MGGEILSTSKDDSLGRCWMRMDGQRIASIQRVIFRHFRPVDSDELRRQFESRCAISLAEAAADAGEQRT
jgi:hypothetical protein